MNPLNNPVVKNFSALAKDIAADRRPTGHRATKLAVELAVFAGAECLSQAAPAATTAIISTLGVLASAVLGPVGPLAGLAGDVIADSGEEFLIAWGSLKLARLAGTAVDYVYDKRHAADPYGPGVDITAQTLVNGERPKGPVHIYQPPRKSL